MIEHGFTGFPWQIPPLKWGPSTVSPCFRTRCSQKGRFILQFPKFPIPLQSLTRRSILHVPVFGQSTPARMAESVDALVSNTSGAIRAGSIPAPGTSKKKTQHCAESFFACTKYHNPCQLTLTSPVRGMPPSAHASVGRPRSCDVLRTSC